MQLFHLARHARLVSGLASLILLSAASPVFGADIFVTSVADSGAGSLRQAILDSNSTASTTDTIKFNIPGAGVHTISITSALAFIDSPVIIDGYTQSGASQNTAPLGEADNAVLKIELDGSNCPFGTDGLTATNTGTPPVGAVIRGLVINRFTGDGIELRTGGVTIEGCFIGVDPSGTIARGNNQSGIHLIAGGFQTLIGGLSPAARNVISANTFQNILLDNVFSQDALIQGNFIGTDASGTQDLGSNQHGIHILNGRFNTIGGAAAGAGNVISGNNSNGIYIEGTAAANNILGNLIGTNNAGTAALPNGFNGVELGAANLTVIGGDTAGAGNLLSGNGFGGVNAFGAKNTAIQGNKIGTDLAGTAAIPNGNAGVVLQQTTTGTLVGGATPLARNVISGNGLDGITVFSARGTKIAGNFIGTDATGLAALGNQSAGIAIFSPTTTVGGADSSARNVVCSNGLFGVAVQTANATGNTIQGNFIGLGADGSTPLGNTGTANPGTGQGVFIEDASSNAVVGNVIAGNKGSGIFLKGSSTGNAIRGNIIGVNAALNAARPNLGAGVEVLSSASNNNTIGGTNPGDGNTIAANRDAGVDLVAGSGNAILGNTISSNGGLGIDLNENGLTPNDALDADAGANASQNFPVLAGVSFSSGVKIVGTLASQANTTYRLEFFASSAADPSGYGEGEIFIGSKDVTADAQGNAPFSASFSLSTAAGAVLSATATDPNGNTSEFSNAIAQSAAESLWLLYR